MKEIAIGCIADDFTGATDIANEFARGGLSVTLVVGVPDSETATAVLEREPDVIVLALKTRSIPAEQAVSESLAALQWLKSIKARRYYFKYCSTFDSTNQGNIGPVTEALLNGLNATFTIHCPAFPRNARTVYQGHLFVGTELLSDSPMRHHPINPMTDANLVRVLHRQTRRSVGLAALDIVRSGYAATRSHFDRLATEGFGHAIVDSIDDSDLATLSKASTGLDLICGGSALGRELGKQMNTHSARGVTGITWPQGATAIIAGSCSTATTRQIERFKGDHQTIVLDPLAGDPLEAVDGILQRTLPHLGKRPLLVYSSASPEQVSEAKRRAGPSVASRIEAALAFVAKAFVEAGVRRLIVAGGETSGAVVKALGLRALYIGQEIAPGVPWTVSVGRVPIALALKSGNFGGDDFFRNAFRLLEEEKT